MRVFISYRSTERPMVQALANDLQGLGHTVWFDTQLTGGQSWWDSIIAQIRACDLFAIALSPASITSKPCVLEREYALALQKSLLPIEVGKVDYTLLPPAISVVQSVRYSQTDRNALLQLAKALGAVQPSPALPTPEPPPPPAPVNSIYTLQQRVNEPILSDAEQLLLWEELDRLLNDATYAESARTLLLALQQHPDLRASIDDRIDQSLRHSPAGRVPAAQPAAPARVTVQPPNPPLQEPAAPEFELQLGETEIARFVVVPINIASVVSSLGNLVGAKSEMFITNQRLVLRGLTISRDIPLSNIASAHINKPLVGQKSLQISLQDGTDIRLAVTILGGWTYGNFDKALAAIQQAMKG